MGKQGETATNKDNNINIIKGLIYSGIPSNMAGYCKLMAQNWHKKFCPRAGQIRGVNYELNIRADRHLYGHLIFVRLPPSRAHMWVP